MTRSPHALAPPLVVALAVPALLGLATPGSSTRPVASCTLQYERADNMWAGVGRPDGDLGVETISLALGQRKVFATDWRYEKMRNDGTNYYGSHLRRAKNTGMSPVTLVYKNQEGAYTQKLYTNNAWVYQHDLAEVACTDGTK